MSAKAIYGKEIPVTLGDLIGMIVWPIVMAAVVVFSFRLPHSLGVRGDWPFPAAIVILVTCVIGLTLLLNPEMRGRNGSSSNCDSQ